PPDVLCAAIRAPEGWKLFFAGQTIQELPGDSVFRVYYAKKIDERPGMPPYANVLSPKAVETFIRITHDRLAEHLGRWFGGTIRFAFTDEPSMIYANSDQLTWTPDFREKFRELKGYDILPYLPCLFEPADGKNDELRARVDYFDARSRLFVERYLLPLRDWCRRHNLLSGGHFGGDDDPKGNVIYGYGHILRSLRALDLPAVDAIWRQLFPDKRSHHFVKYASSVGRQMRQPLVMTESYAAYGSGLTLAEMKWALDQQYARGATMLVCSNYPYSTRDHFMVGCRPHFGKYHPLWKYVNAFHQYAARLGYLLSRGRPLCKTAVYYDVRSIWAGGRTGEQAVERHDRLAETLLQSQCEFDFVDDDILAGEGGRMENGCLVVGPMRYEKLLVPATDWMDEKALAGAAEFVRKGGTLIVLDGALAANGGTVELPDDLTA
ncbi:MAG: glycosyl hydrolase, partial [Kiritimatiellae bacterium]|nr:glycosyl hydrolase [Kiritimatiellia bacterium]